MTTIAFTGHRPAKIGGYDMASPLRKAVYTALQGAIDTMISIMHYHSLPITFISGMALGVDQDAARIVLSRRLFYPNIKLYAYLPHPEQAARWTEAFQNYYGIILDQCDKVQTISPIYTATCMQARNQAMVDAADYLIAVWDGSPSGTKQTVEYARSQGRLVVHINPKTLLRGLP